MQYTPGPEGVLDFQKKIRTQIEENINLKKSLLEDTFLNGIETCVGYCTTALKSGGKILFCGNGGSAADSQHLAAELVVRLRGSFNRPSLPAIALTVNSSVLTAAGNDFGFNAIFSRQVESIGQPGDVLMAISTSGNSRNIIEAVKTAREKEIKTIGFLGGSGGELAGLVDLPLIIPSATTARIQEAHILIGHIICQLVEETLFQ
ncbi:MAG: SIS domain-containing protein [Calditrichia bacterium]